MKHSLMANVTAAFGGLFIHRVNKLQDVQRQKTAGGDTGDSRRCLPLDVDVKGQMLKLH